MEFFFSCFLLHYCCSVATLVPLTLLLILFYILEQNMWRLTIILFVKRSPMDPWLFTSLFLNPSLLIYWIKHYLLRDFLHCATGSRLSQDLWSWGRMLELIIYYLVGIGHRTTPVQMRESSLFVLQYKIHLSL